MPRALTSGSNVFRRQLCEGSENAEAGLEEVESNDSNRGTRLHDLFKDYWKGIVNPTLSHDEKELFRIVHEEVLTKCVQIFGGLPEEKCFQWEVDLEAKSGDFYTPGHGDLVVTVGRRAAIFDWKFGFIAVEPASINPQMRIYALGKAREMGGSFDFIDVEIIQPTLPLEERFSHARYDHQSIPAAVYELLDIRTKAANPKAKRKASADACRYCKARFTCKEAHKNLKIMPALKDDLKFIQNIPKMLPQVYAAQKLIKDIKERAKALAITGAWKPENDGFQLRPGKSRRTATSPAAVWAKVEDDLTQDQFQACLQVSIAKLQDKLVDEKKITAKNAKDAVRDKLGETMITTYDKPSLVQKGDVEDE